MSIQQSTSQFIRVNPRRLVIDTGSRSTATGEQTVGLASAGLEVPRLSSMIRVYAVVTSLTGGVGSTLNLRDMPGGGDVAGAASPVIGVPGAWGGMLDLNGGRVTYAAIPGGASTYSVQIYVTGFLRYA